MNTDIQEQEIEAETVGIGNAFVPICVHPCPSVVKPSVPSFPANAGFITWYSRQHMIGQILLCCRRNHKAMRDYLERSLDARLRQIMEKICP